MQSEEGVFRKIGLGDYRQRVVMRGSGGIISHRMWTYQKIVECLCTFHIGAQLLEGWFHTFGYIPVGLSATQLVPLEHQRILSSVGILDNNDSLQGGELLASTPYT